MRISTLFLHDSGYLIALTLDLLVWQWWDGDERILLTKPFVKPVEMLVSPRDLDAVKLETKKGHHCKL